MSTHASIIVKTADGIYQGCYLHHDGYPAHAGHVLNSDFNVEALANKLAAMNMVEAINTGGFIQPWDDPKDAAKPVFGATIEEIVKKQSTLHVYVYENGAWTYDQVPLLADFRRDPKWSYRGRKLIDAATHDFNVRYHNGKRTA